jgi:hypothetical protein
MTDDLLARATRALREESAGDDASARFTRSRIMASVHEERVKRRTRWAFLIPIAATFIAASAYGAATGKTREALLIITRALGIHRSELAPPPPRPTVRRSAPEPAATVAPAPTPSVTDAPPPPPLEPVPDTAATVSAAPSEVSPPAPKPARAPLVEGDLSAAAPARALPDAGAAAADPTFELYRVAHHAHFVERDYAQALSAWDAYLKAAPNGALVPEARYNRALCLVRLHRNDEARAALKPFAEGRYGTYRREDAAKLSAALPAGLAGPEP